MKVRPYTVTLAATVASYNATATARFDDATLNGQTLFFAEDSLGTSRVITDVNGVVCYDADFYPFGGERPYTNNCTSHYKFEGKERDAETNNDYFGARYYSNRLGRWLSADWSAVPVAVPYATLANPQTLNLYSMVGDDPETSAVLDGHCPPSGLNPCQDNNAAPVPQNPEQQSQTSQTAQQAQNRTPETQPVVTMKVIIPTFKIQANRTETVVGFGVANMDANGKVTAPDPKEEHTLTMTETLDTKKSKGPEPIICASSCGGNVVGTGTLKDTMRVSGKNVVVLDKRFTIDGKPAKVFDPGTGRVRDFVHQESTVKNGTNLTYGDNP